MQHVRCCDTRDSKWQQFNTERAPAQNQAEGFSLPSAGSPGSLDGTDDELREKLADLLQVLGSDVP